MKKILKLLILLFLVTGFWIQSSTNLSAQMSNEGDGDVTLLCPECTDTGGGDDDGNTGGGGNGPNPGNGGGGIDPNDLYWDAYYAAVDDGIDDPFDDPNTTYSCPMKLVSRTNSTVPSNTDRKTLGIGEIVTVSIIGDCESYGKSWGLRQDFGTNGFIISQTATSCKFNAGTIPGKFSLILTLSGSSAGPNCMTCPTELSLDYTITCPRLISETVVTSPSDRARTKVGIGEEIKIVLLGGDGCDGGTLHGALTTYPEQL